MADAASFTVTAVGLSWSPSSLTIEVGDSVTFSFDTGVHTWVRDDVADSCDSTCSRTFSTATTVQYHCGIHLGMTGTVQVGPGATITIATPTPGAIVAGLVRVEGTASAPTGSISSVTVRFDSGSPVTATLDAVGGWSADISSLGLAEGGHTIHARATSTGGIVGEASVDVTVDNADRIDLRPTSVRGQSSATQTNTISYAIRNDGNVPSGAFRARAEYLYQGEWHPIGERTQASIAALATGVGTIRWDPALVLVGSFQVRVTADATGIIAETDETNNARPGTASWFSGAVPGTDPTDPI